MKYDGGPAFSMPSGPEPRMNSVTHYNEGMTLRDYFAAAIQDEAEDYGMAFKVAFMVRPCPDWSTDPVGCLQWEAEWRAKWRGIRADAMIAERSKGDSK